MLHEEETHEDWETRKIFMIPYLEKRFLDTLEVPPEKDTPKKIAEKYHSCLIGIGSVDDINLHILVDNFSKKRQEALELMKKYRDSVKQYIGSMEDIDRCRKLLQAFL